MTFAPLDTELEGLVATLFCELTQRGFRQGERLWTAEPHGDPVGRFQLVKESRHLSFGKQLVAQTWSRDL